MGNNSMKTIMAIRICSPQKDFTAHTLCGIYTNPMLQAFFKKMQQLQLPYGVFSRKNGIQPEGDNHHAYSSIEEIPDTALISLLQKQVSQYQNTRFLYWNHRPLTHSKYVKMMRDVGLEVIELRTLKEFEAYSR